MSNVVVIPVPSDPVVLRHIDLNGYTLLLWDCLREKNRKSILGYALYAPNEKEPVFVGEDFYCSPLDPIDSDKTVRSLLSYLTLKIGDTDRSYFDYYTPRQLNFAMSEAEALSLYAEEDMMFVDKE